MRIRGTRVRWAKGSEGRSGKEWQGGKRKRGRKKERKGGVKENVPQPTHK